MAEAGSRIASAVAVVLGTETVINISNSLALGVKSAPLRTAWNRLRGPVAASSGGLQKWPRCSPADSGLGTDIATANATPASAQKQIAVARTARTFRNFSFFACPMCQ